jgi:hypothetical protein
MVTKRRSAMDSPLILVTASFTSGNVSTPVLMFS